MRSARFHIGQIVRHRTYPFRGVIYDVDPVFSSDEEWWESIPEDIRPEKDQPYYHLLAENDQGPYMAYVSEQNLLEDESGDPVDHPDVEEYFETMDDEGYIPYQRFTN
jgi:heat shock protein HspQ